MTYALRGWLCIQLNPATNRWSWKSKSIYPYHLSCIFYKINNGCLRWIYVPSIRCWVHSTPWVHTYVGKHIVRQHSMQSLPYEEQAYWTFQGRTVWRLSLKPSTAYADLPNIYMDGPYCYHQNSKGPVLPIENRAHNEVIAKINSFTSGPMNELDYLKS